MSAATLSVAGPSCTARGLVSNSRLTLTPIALGNGSIDEGGLLSKRRVPALYGQSVMIRWMDDTRPPDGKLFAKLFARVREVLMRDWDPIGIAHIDDGPEDEYDEYARALCGRLFDPDLSEEGIKNYLTRVAEIGMELPPNRDAIDRAARAVAALRKEFFGAD